MGTTQLEENLLMPGAPGLFLYFPERARHQPKLQALLSVLRAIETKLDSAKAFDRG